MNPSTPDDLSATTGTDLDDLTLQVAEERLDVTKRRVTTGVVRVSTTTEAVEHVAEVELEHRRVEVTHVPVDRIVEEVPLTRTEGDVTIVPVIEERFVVVKQIYLREELHIRRVVERETVAEPVTLRRQRVTVSRLDGSGAGAEADDS